MIIWRGNGIWALTLVALIVAGAGEALGTDNGVPAGLVAAAVLVFLLRSIWGDDASAFFVPVRFWPTVLLVLAVLGVLDRRPGISQPGGKMSEVAAELQGKWPRMINDNIRAESAEYGDKTLRYHAKALTWFDRSSPAATEFEQVARRKYCEGAKALARNGISVEYDVLVPPRSFNDRVERFSIVVRPTSCRP